MNVLRSEHVFPGGIRLQLVQGDLTEEHVNAIVNAANRFLMHGGGVAGAIVRKGGPQIQVESDAWVKEHGPVPYRWPAHTRAGNLPCKYVIHAVGPEWGEGDEDAKLKAAVYGTLEVAGELNCRSLSMPAIATGIYGFPKDRAAWVILGTMVEFFSAHPPTSLEQVRVVLFDTASLDAFEGAWRNLGLGKDQTPQK